jgi:hypothetical protein
MDLARQKEEEKTKEMDKEEGMMEKHKKKVKLHHLRTPLPRQKTSKKRKVSPENLRQERRHAPVSPR